MNENSGLSLSAWLLIIGVLSFSGNSSACICDGEYKFEEEYRLAGTIIIGKVIEIVHENELFVKNVPIIGEMYCSYNNCWSKVKIRIEKKWKGEDEEVTKIRWDETCRWSLKVGDRMLIFARPIDGQLLASCGLSNLVSNSAIVIDQLDQKMKR